MKKLAVWAALLFSLALIVLPGFHQVNLPQTNVSPAVGTLSADGNPLPPPIPPTYSQVSGSLVADGNPLPPPIPPTSRWPTASLYPLSA